MKFKLGDKVKFLNDDLAGIIVKITETGRYVIKSHDGFEYEELGKNLVPDIDFSHYVNVNVFDLADKNQIQKKNKISKSKTGKRKKQFWREVDLHIETLLEDHHNLTNAELLQIQTSVFTRELDRAIINNERKIIFIHGVGQGVLREEIRSIIRLEYPEVECFDGSYKNYGFGATEVIIHK